MAQPQAQQDPLQDIPEVFPPDAKPQGTPKSPVQLREEMRPREPLTQPLRTSGTFQAATPEQRTPFPQRAPGGPRDIPFIGSTMNDFIRRRIVDYEARARQSYVLPMPRTIASGVGGSVGIAAGGALGAETGPGAFVTGFGGGGAGSAIAGGEFDQFMGRPTPGSQSLADFMVGGLQFAGGRYLSKIVRWGGAQLTQGELVAGMVLDHGIDLLAESVKQAAGWLPPGVSTVAKIVGALGVKALERVMKSEAFSALDAEGKSAAVKGMQQVTQYLTDHPNLVTVSRGVASATGQVAGNVGAHTAPKVLAGAEEVEKRVEPQDTSGGQYWMWHYAKEGPNGGYITQFQPQQERQFLQFAKENPGLGIDTGRTSEYDWRGWWNSGAGFEAGADGNAHLPEEWKTPYNPSFNRRSHYAVKNAPQLNSKGQVVDAIGRVLYDPAKTEEAKPPKEGAPESGRSPEPTPQATGPPAGGWSDDVVFKLAGAIAKHEGFFKEGSSPQRMNNPGSMQRGAEFFSYPTAEKGWYALYDNVRNNYNPQWTIQQFAHKYDPEDEDNWAKGVADLLGVTPETRISDIDAAKSQ